MKKRVFPMRYRTQDRQRRSVVWKIGTTLPLLPEKRFQSVTANVARMLVLQPQDDQLGNPLRYPHHIRRVYRFVGGDHDEGLQPNCRATRATL